MKVSFLLFFLVPVLLSCQKEEEFPEEYKAPITANECASICDMQPNPGSCMAYYTRYYFDSLDGRCKEFTWGGCGGRVPFETLKDCESCGCQ